MSEEELRRRKHMTHEELEREAGRKLLSSEAEWHRYLIVPPKNYYVPTYALPWSYLD